MVQIRMKNPDKPVPMCLVNCQLSERDDLCKYDLCAIYDQLSPRTFF